MTLRPFFALFGTTVLLATMARADDVEVLAKGPVHEAFAEPSERQPAPTPIIPKAPPKAIEELPPDQKPEGDNVQWIPGYWGWDEDKKDFLWVSGFWRVAPPGRSWVPGSWRPNGDGYQWIGGFWTQAKEGKAAIEYLPQPPAPLDEAGPSTAAPSETHVYVPGSWMYRERYVWRPGYWIEHRPNWVWTSAHYRWTPAGYIYIDGYWDHPLASRGVLFAPVYISPAVYAVPTYVYTPTVIVREECLYGAFFHRRGFGAYYFGDYFAPRYASIGFCSWNGYFSASVRIGGGWCDPLFSYYRCGYRNDPFWRAGVNDLYVGRYRGDYARPPVTLVQQNTVINNITNNKTVIKNNTVNVNNVTMLTSIRDQKQVGNLAIQKVPEKVVKEQQVAAKQLRDTGTRRLEQETKLTAQAGGQRPTKPLVANFDVPTSPTRPVASPRPGAELPKTGAALGTPGTKIAPTAPKPTPIGITPKPGAKIDGGVGLPKVDPKIPALQPKIEPRPGPKLPDPPKVEARPKVDPKPMIPAPLPKIETVTPKPNVPVPPRPMPKVEAPAPKIPVNVAPPTLPKADPPSRPATPPRPSTEPKKDKDPKKPGRSVSSYQSATAIRTVRPSSNVPVVPRSVPSRAPTVSPAVRATPRPAVAPRVQPAPPRAANPARPPAKIAPVRPEKSKSK